ncbi:MAG: hypothetical protein VKJ06_01055 [Vampirovibrionales bacterium]|nr:hypothetical protein [Vampirovibrionales bacterium]
MISPIGFYKQVMPVMQAHTAAGQMFAVNDQRLANLNQPAQAIHSPAQAHALDKALTLKGIQANINYLVAIALQQKNAEEAKKAASSPAFGCYSSQQAAS